MSRIAFYAPLKPPTHPNPSGDRLLARLLIQALEQAGFEVELASRFRSYDRQGDPQRQQRLKAVGQRLAKRLIDRYLRLPPSQRPQLWFSYHLYHKAPDWIGPQVCQALQVPYVIAEASYAAKQQQGPWQQGLAASLRALEQARLIIGLNPVDSGGIQQQLPYAPLHRLPPFLQLAPFPSQPPEPKAKQQLKRQLAAQYSLDPQRPWLICVAMMRPGDKLDSYHLLAQALQKLFQKPNRCPWQLLVVGAGQMQSTVETLLAPLGPHCLLLGKLPNEQIIPLLQASDLYLWPAVNEAFGMALLEAQACGLPVLAGDEGGVSSIVQQGQGGWLTPARDSQALADQLERLLTTPEQLQDASTKAWHQVRQHHSLDAASAKLNQLLTPLIQGGD